METGFIKVLSLIAEEWERMEVKEKIQQNTQEIGDNTERSNLCVIIRPGRKDEEE